MIENKIYKEIAEIRGRIILGIMLRAKNSSDYHEEKLDELNKTVYSISHKDKWDYYGIVTKEDLIKLELLEKLIAKDE